MDWTAQAKSALENMGSPDDLFEMPLCRFAVLNFGRANETVTKITNREDLIAWQKERAKRRKGG